MNALLGDVVESDLALLAEGGMSPRAGWYYQAAASADSTLWSYLPERACVLFHEEGFVEKAGYKEGCFQEKEIKVEEFRYGTQKRIRQFTKWSRLKRAAAGI